MMFRTSRSYVSELLALTCTDVTVSLVQSLFQMHGIVLFKPSCFRKMNSGVWPRKVTPISTANLCESQKLSQLEFFFALCRFTVKAITDNIIR